MKFLFSLLFIINFTYASVYDISYSNIKLGEIKNINTIYNDYIEIEVTNSIARLLLGKSVMIYYNSSSTINKDDKNIKFKKDSYEVINIIKLAIEGNFINKRIELEKGKHIDLKLENEKYHFKYFNSNGVLKSEGSILIKDKELISLVDDKNYIEIKKE